MPTISIEANGRYTMGALVEIIKQVPPLAWVIVVALAFGALWRVFNVLYVKLRDFRIESLEREIEKLKPAPRDHESGTTSTATEPARLLSADVPLSPIEPHTPKIARSTASISEQQHDDGDTLAEGLRSLTITLARLHDSSLTKLQRESVKEYFTGKHVIWTATVKSVGNTKQGSITVWLVEGDDISFSAAARFDESQKAELLKLQEGDHVLVSGRIDSIIAGSPFLEQCSITKTPDSSIQK